ncbi:DGF-1-like protein, putative, partial [Bodo saltans]
MRALSLIIAILISLAPLVAAQARYVVNGGTITSSVTLSAPTTIVEITGVTFSGALSFTIDISHMASSSRPVWVTLCNCVFQNAAALYFPADTSGVDTSKRPVYINIEGTQFIDGGLGFRGYFPLATRIVIAHVTVRINSRASLLPQWNPFNGGGDGRFAYWMALYNFYLQTQSSILFTGCDFGGSWASGTGKTAHASFPISLANSVNFIDRSSFWIRNTVTAKVFMIHSHGDVYATTLSSFVVENMTMVCDRFCLSFDAGNLQFSDRSVFVMADSSASVPLGQEGEDLFFTRSTTLFTTSSAFIIKNNVLSPYRYAFSVDPSVTFTVSTNSIATFYKNSVAGTPWRMTIATNNGGVALAQCNDLAGAPMRQIDQYQTAGLHGLTAASPCPRRTTDCQFSNSSCFMPGTVGMTATCECQCNSIGVGPSCLGSIRPLYVNQCLETASLLPTLTQRITLTERQSATRTVNAATVTHFKGTHSVSSSITEWRTTTKTKSPTITRDRKREASNTRRATPTHTFELTLTQWVTPSKTNPWVSTSSSVSHSRPRSETRSTSGEATATPTYRETRTHTLRLTRTALLTPTTTHSDEPSVTTSPTRTAVLSLSQALTPSHTRNTPSYTTQSATVTVTVNPPLTETVNLISLSWLATPTETHLLSPTDTLTPSPTGSETPSPSGTQNATVSETLTASVTVTSTLTASGSGSSSASETVTLTSTASLTNSSALTLSRTHSVTKSRSDCDWFVLGLEPIAPLALSSAGNNTMTIDYLTALEFGERFNLTGLGQWYVIATDYVGESSGVNETTSADLNVAAVVSGRIPTYYAPETERSITIGVTFRCAVVNHREIYTIVITPLPPVLSAAALETLLRLTSLASVLTVSPAAAAAAALSLIMQQIMLCRPLYENSAVSLAGLSIGDGDPMYLRGALVTNLLVVLCEAVLVSAFAAGIIVYSKSTMNAMRFWRVMEMLQWPNVMHISVSALLQLSTTAAVSLMSIADTVEDGGAAVLAFSCCFGYTVWITRQVYVMHKRTTGSARKWNMAEGLTTSGFVFGDYSKAWFVALETVVSFLVGLVAGIPPSLEVCLVQLFFIFF